MKTCSTCKEFKLLEAFDQQLGRKFDRASRCKSCQSISQKQRRKRPDVIDQRHAYMARRLKTERGKAKKMADCNAYNRRHPDRASAHRKIADGLRHGKIQRQPCQFCGDTKSQAHHHDYSKPLDVVWCCFKCHREKMHGQTVSPTKFTFEMPAQIMV